MSTLVAPPARSTVTSRIIAFESEHRGATRPAMMAHSIVRLSMQVVDLIAMAVVLGGLAATALRGDNGAWSHGVSLRVIAAALAVTVWANHAQVYTLRRVLRARSAALAALPALIVGVVVDVAALKLAGISWPPLLEGATLATTAGAAYLLLSRVVWAWICRAGLRSGQLAYRGALVGPGCESWLGRQSSRRSPFLSVVGHYDSAGGPFHAQGPELSRLLARTKRRRVDAIVLCYPEGVAERRRHAFTLLRASVADIFMHDDMALCPLLPRDHPLAGFAVIPLQRRALTDGNILCKALIDRLGGLVLLALLSPLFALTALAIRLDSPGPIFFRQPRVGYNNVLFRMFKFRSMHTHMTDHLATRQTTQDDPRVTRVGRFLRRFSIDELPQLLNVVRGDMSLVGPRPHAPGTNVDGLLLEHASPYYPLRHRVLPGITGWAQINGSRGALCTPEQLRRRVRLDLFYVEKWSVLLDLKIMFLTATREILSRRAC